MQLNYFIPVSITEIKMTRHKYRSFSEEQKITIVKDKQAARSDTFYLIHSPGYNGQKEFLHHSLVIIPYCQLRMNKQCFAISEVEKSMT